MDHRCAEWEFTKQECASADRGIAWAYRHGRSVGFTSAAFMTNERRKIKEIAVIAHRLHARLSKMMARGKNKSVVVQRRRDLLGVIWAHWSEGEATHKNL